MIGDYSPSWDGIEIYADGFSAKVKDNIASNGGKWFINKVTTKK